MNQLPFTEEELARKPERQDRATYMRWYNSTARGKDANTKYRQTPEGRRTLAVARSKRESGDDYATRILTTLHDDTYESV